MCAGKEKLNEWPDNDAADLMDNPTGRKATPAKKRKAGDERASFGEKQDGRNSRNRDSERRPDCHGRRQSKTSGFSFAFSRFDKSEENSRSSSHHFKHQPARTSDTL